MDFREADVMKQADVINVIKQDSLREIASYSENNTLVSHGQMHAQYNDSMTNSVIQAHVSIKSDTLFSKNILLIKDDGLPTVKQAPKAEIKPGMNLKDDIAKVKFEFNGVYSYLN